MATRTKKPAHKGGRPKMQLPPEVIKRIGPPPVDAPLKLARWWTSLLAECVWLQAQGHKGIDKLAREIRTASSAAGRVLPHDIQFEAARRINQDNLDLEGESGPVEEDVDTNEPKRTRSVRSNSPRG